MKRDYKIYKKSGYTYVHYDGFPKGIKIEKNKNLYDYEWGWMTVTHDGKYYEFHDDNHSLFFNLLWDGSVFEANNRYGVIDKDGNEVLPPVFDQIEKLGESVFGRLGNSYWEFKEFGSSTLRGKYGNSGFFVENGKKGWRNDSVVVIPAEYDDIKHASNSNFYMVLQNRQWFYINEKGDRVLTNVREIEGAENTIPFPFHTGENDVLVLQEYVGHEDENDNNVVLLHDVWQRLDRISGKEICKVFINPNDELPLTDKDLELFNNNFSYEYAAYQVKSQEPMGIIDCLKKLQAMGLHSNTWHYIVKVWKCPEENPEAEELRFLRYQIEENGQIGKLHFCLAHDRSLHSGETKMFVVTHYNERCWPASWEFDWWDNRNELSLDNIKKELTKLRRIINKSVLPPFKQEVWEDQLHGCIYSMEYSKKRTWNETLKVLDYFKSRGAQIVNGIRSEAEKIDFTLRSKNLFSRAKCSFHLRKLKWLLDNGADVNAHYGNYAGLDYLAGNYKHFGDDNFCERDKVYIDDMRSKITDLLIEHGAKTLQQLREEESSNEDYKVELMRMS